MTRSMTSPPNSPASLSKYNPGYGWLVLSLSTMVMVGIYGTELSFGVYVKPMLEEFGWNRTLVSATMSILMGISGPFGILTGRMTDKYGPRVVITLGGVLAASGYVAMSLANSLWHLYLFFGIFLGLSISTCWPPLIATVSSWFRDKRVLAIGILTSGLTIGSMCIPPLIASLIDIHGWRASFWVMALIVVITTLPALFVLRKRPNGDFESPHQAEKEGGAITDEDASVGRHEWTALGAAGTLSFLMILTIGFVTATGFFFLAVHLVPYATDLGFRPTSAALIFSFLSIGNILGKLLAWVIARRLGNRSTLALFVGLQALAIFSLVAANALWLLFALGALFGFGLGGSMAIRMSLIPDFFGTAVVGTLVGIAGNAWGLGGIVGPIFAGYIFDRSQSYDLAFFTGGSLLLMGVVASFLLKPPDDGPGNPS